MLNNYSKKIWFPNGFGLSIVCKENSYGGRSGLFEIGLLHKGHEGKLFYGPGWGDVRGFLDFDGVAKTIEEVKAYSENRPIGPMGGPYHPAIMVRVAAI